MCVKPMKILHIASNYPPKVGGPATTVPQLCKELKKNKIGCIVATHGYKDSKSKSIEDGIIVYRTKDTDDKFYSTPLAIRRIYLLSRVVNRIIEEEKIDIIHAHDINISAIAGIIGSIGKNKIRIAKYPGDLALETMNLKNRSFKNPDEFFRKKSIIIKTLHILQKIICSKYDLIITPSNYMKKSLITNSNINPKKIRVIYNTINQEKYSNFYIKKIRADLIDNNKYLITSACRMVPWKGLDTLIQTFDNMPKDIKLILIGDGPERKRLENMSKGKNIEFLGKIKHKQIQAYLKASDIIIQPSYYEPSSIALLDCLATQTPVIASSVGGTPEIIEDKKDGILITDHNPETYTKAIKKLLANKTQIQQIKTHQKESYEKKKWNYVIKDFIDAYQSVIR